MTYEKTDPLTTCQLSDEEFMHLKDGKFFKLVLDHPEVQVYRYTEGIFYARLPGIGAVGFSKHAEKPSERKS